MTASAQRQRQRGSDRGDATAQLVIVTPVLVLLIFLAVQAAIYFHAANVAAAAASQGAAAASPRAAGAGDGIAAAQALMADLGADPAGAPVVNVSDGYVSVTVTVDVAQIVPFFPDSVSRSALEPQERFVPESDR